MLMFPYRKFYSAVQCCWALIGAERQWRQRMAGLRTMRWSPPARRFLF